MRKKKNMRGITPTIGTSTTTGLKPRVLKLKLCVLVSLNHPIIFVLYTKKEFLSK